MKVMGIEPAGKIAAKLVLSGVEVLPTFFNKNLIL
jgi:hypothetical protein